MALHILEPTRATLHGCFSRDLPPALTIDPGDTVRARTLDVGWGLEPPTTPTAPRRKFELRDRAGDDGPALCGPIAIRGAASGMALEIAIESVRPSTWGWTWAGSTFSDLNGDLGVAGATPHLMRWELDSRAMVGRNQHGQVVRLRPFLGTIGMPPAEPGMHSAWAPRFCGGNMDCKELVAGSTLYLPIAAPGGLVSLGDGHAAQGDGEVGGMAIECMIDQVELTFHVRDNLRLRGPRARTPSSWVTLGFDTDLRAASAMAMNGMLDLLYELHQIERTEALALASVAVDLRITQLVNGVRGVHAVLADGAIGVQSHH
jgi:acetamidase/formamidase